MSEENISITIEKDLKENKENNLPKLSDEELNYIENIIKSDIGTEKEKEIEKPIFNVWAHQNVVKEPECAFCLLPLSKTDGCACILCIKPYPLCKLCFCAHMGFHSYIGNDALNSEILSSDEKDFYKNHMIEALELQNKTDMF
jgi:hypothetical protein